MSRNSFCHRTQEAAYFIITSMGRNVRLEKLTSVVITKRLSAYLFTRGFIKVLRLTAVDFTHAT